MFIGKDENKQKESIKHQFNQQQISSVLDQFIYDSWKTLNNFIYSL